MTIIINYDNDAVCIGNDSQSKMIEYKITGSMRQIQGLLIEVCNALCSDGKSNIYVSLLKQDEGEITTIEEY